MAICRSLEGRNYTSQPTFDNERNKTHFYMTWLYAVAMRAETTHASQHLTMKETKTPFITWLHFDTHQMQEFPSKP